MNNTNTQNELFNGRLMQSYLPPVDKMKLNIKLLSVNLNIVHTTPTSEKIRCKTIIGVVALK
ncbi:MAG: hypothetical protein IT246_05225 [Bacteroidia bacterium]|nr:hypothetical protein [Bacteroidia bacterium]